MSVGPIAVFPWLPRENVLRGVNWKLYGGKWNSNFNGDFYYTVGFGFQFWDTPCM